MTRSVVRLFAGLAVAALLPTVAQAQACPVIGGGSCSVSRNATMTIPQIATINVTAVGDIALTLPVDYSTLIADSTATLATETAAPLTMRSNTPFGVTIAAGALTGPVGGLVVGDFGFKFSTTGTCTAGGFTAFTGAAQTLIAASTAATNGASATLCLETNFTGNFATKLQSGGYSLPLTLTITAP